MAGYWKGTATEEGSNRSYEAVALIDADGNAQWLLTRTGLLEDDGFVVSANVCCESEFEDDATGKELGETQDSRCEHRRRGRRQRTRAASCGSVAMTMSSRSADRPTTTAAFRLRRSPVCTRSARRRYSAKKSR